MKKIILLFMCIFIVSCSNEASVGLSDSLDLYNDILDVKFVEEEGIYYIVTDKKIEHKSGVSVVLYENSKNSFFDWLLSFIGVEDKSRVVGVYSLGGPITPNYKYGVDKDGHKYSYIYTISIGVLGLRTLINKILIDNNTEIDDIMYIPK